MKTGRKKTPTALNELRGNPGKRKPNTNEPTPPDGAITCPTWLGAIAKQEWRRVAPILKHMGLLTCADRALLAGYCAQYQIWHEAQKDIAERGISIETSKGGTCVNPSVWIATSALKQIKSICCEFGMTPSARAGMNVDIDLPDRPKESDNKSDFWERQKERQAMARESGFRIVDKKKNEVK